MFRKIILVILCLNITVALIGFFILFADIEYGCWCIAAAIIIGLVVWKKRIEKAEREAARQRAEAARERAEASERKGPMRISEEEKYRLATLEAEFNAFVSEITSNAVVREFVNKNIDEFCKTVQNQRYNDSKAYFAIDTQSVRFFGIFDVPAEIIFLRNEFPDLMITQIPWFRNAIERMVRERLKLKLARRLLKSVELKRGGSTLYVNYTRAANHYINW